MSRRHHAIFNSRDLAMRVTKSLLKRETELTPDSVEWCPLEGFRDIVAVGTYQVEKSDNEEFSGDQRQGRIYLDKSCNDRDVFVHSRDHGPVLDMKWGGDNVLAVADALGRLSLLSLEKDEEGHVSLSDAQAKSIVASEDNLVLSLDWNNRRTGHLEDRQLVLSDSQGSVQVIQVSNQRELQCTFESRCHDFEAWIACFDSWHPQVIFSGGDDSKLKVHDIRTDGTSAVFVSKEHTAGVTSLLSNVGKEHELFSGRCQHSRVYHSFISTTTNALRSSYDERLLVWDTRNGLRRPRMERNVGGGIWRIRQHPCKPNLLATACMGAGFVLLGAEQLEESVRYDVHGSLAYGVDFCWSRERDLLASCSFYDRLYSRWEVLEGSEDDV